MVKLIFKPVAVVIILELRINEIESNVVGAKIFNPYILVVPVKVTPPVFVAINTLKLKLSGSTLFKF